MGFYSEIERRYNLDERNQTAKSCRKKDEIGHGQKAIAMLV
jgi:hypothetical protein